MWSAPSIVTREMENEPCRQCDEPGSVSSDQVASLSATHIQQRESSGSAVNGALAAVRRAPVISTRRTDGHAGLVEREGEPGDPLVLGHVEVRPGQEHPVGRADRLTVAIRKSGSTR